MVFAFDTSTESSSLDLCITQWMDLLHLINQRWTLTIVNNLYIEDGYWPSPHGSFGWTLPFERGWLVMAGN